MQYVAERFSPDEAEILRPYFTNLDRPVFALVNLPEVVKGALFARYSRSPKSLRRLFLDEFVGDLDLTGDVGVDASVGLRAGRGALRAGLPRVRRRLRRPARWRAPRVRAVVERAHEDPRVGPAHGLPRAVHPLHPVRHRASVVVTATTGRPRCSTRPSAPATSPTWTPCSTSYAGCLAQMLEWARETYPKEPGDSDFVYKQTLKAKACDATRGILPAATLSNVGIYGTGQAFEALLLRMRAHPLPEARRYAAMMLEELRKVIPSFLTRVDRADRGIAWSAYLAETRTDTAALVGAAVPCRRTRAAAHGRAQRLRPRRRGQAACRALLPAHGPPRGPDPRSGPPPVVRRTGRAAHRVRRRPREPSSPPGSGVRASRLPLRRAGRLRRVPRPAASPDAHDRVAATRTAPRLRRPARASPTPASRVRSSMRWNDRLGCTTRSRSTSPSRRRMRLRSRTACGS